MNALFVFEFSLKGLMLALLVGALLGVLSYTSSRYLEIGKSRSRIVNTLSRFTPHFKAGLGFLYLLWAFSIIFPNPVLAGLLIVFLVGFSFYWCSQFFLKDFIAGISLKSRPNFADGSLISTKHFRGVIARLGLLTVEIQQEDLSTLVIPYSQIVGRPITISEGPAERRIHTLTLSVPGRKDKMRTLQHLKNYILNSPLTIPGDAPLVQIVNESEREFTVRIRARLISAEVKDRFNQEMKTQLENTVAKGE